MERNGNIDNPITAMPEKPENILTLECASNQELASIRFSKSDVLERPKEFYFVERPRKEHVLFEGPGRKMYSAGSMGKILKIAAFKAGIRKQVTPHMLRHSFATHLSEHVVDVRYIQTLLGHESGKTTEIYTHISKRSLANIKSPLDQILQDNHKDNK